MKLSSTLLATAAGFLVVTGAQAADLPTDTPPAAVDYVKVCDAFGSGFFYIPGTETCLDISGRVRFRTTYYSDNGPKDDTAVQFRADARVDFDARTATEMGTLRSFFRLATDSDDGISVDAAYISLGYLTIGYAGDIFNGDSLYGIDDNHDVSPIHDYGDALQVTALVDDIGGGFYVGASILSQTTGDLRVTTTTDIEDNLTFEGVAGISGQPWGSLDLSLAYKPESGDDLFAAKLTADLKVLEGLDARLVVAYADEGDSTIGLRGGLSYAASDKATIYTGFGYDFVENADDLWIANAGVDYALLDGLTLTGEVSYLSEVKPALDEEFRVRFQLSRSW